MKLASTRLIKISSGKYFLYICILLIYLSSLSISQNIEPKFEHFTTIHGLPENSVSCIMQDHLGYIWFGTQNGLVQYDGYKMIVYRSDPLNQNKLSNGLILCLYEDRRKNIWIGTSDGLNCFDRTSGKFTRYLFDNTDSTGINAKIINCVYEDSKGRLWIGTSKGLSLFDQHTRQFKHFNFQQISYKREFYDYISNLKKSNKIIESILNVGNDADIKQTFILKESTPVLIVMMGEENNDYGWIEDEKGNVVFDYDIRSTRYAGGSIINRIQVKVDTLPAGKYSLHYISNLTYSYQNNFSNIQLGYSWGVFTAPTFKENWGIQVFNLSDQSAKLLTQITTQYYEETKSDVFTISENPSDRRLLIGGSCEGLWTLDEKQHVIIPLDLKDDGNKYTSIGFVRDIAFNRQKEIWLATTKGVVHLNKVNERFTLYQIIPSNHFKYDNLMHCIVQGSDGLIYSGNALGCLLQINPQAETFKLFKPNPNDPSGLAGGALTSLAVDRSGILFIGTWATGLQKWDNKRWKFQHITKNTSDPNSLVDPGVNTIYEDADGILWLGTYSGMVAYDRINNNYTYFKKESGNTNSLSCDSIQYLIGDPIEEKIIWIGTFGGGLNKFNKKSSSFSHYRYEQNNKYSLSSDFIQIITFDHSGNLWIGTGGGGLNKFDKLTEKFVRYQYEPDNLNSLNDDFVYFIREDNSGLIWVGTNGFGVNCIDPKTNEIGLYLSPHKKVLYRSVISILEDEFSNLWLGTYLDGLLLFDKKNDSVISRINENNGLLNNSAHFLFEDGLGNIWVRTAAGLQSFNPSSKAIKNFDISDGLVLMSNNASPTFYQSKIGEVFIGGSNGFNIFHPDSIKDDPVPPQVVIENISLFNRPDEKLSYEGFIPELEMIELPYNQNDLHFEYVGLHFSEPARNKHKYILEGFDENWIDAGNQRTATYTNLDPGEYIFKVTAANRDGVWNEQGTSIKIIINPPIWATTWAYLFYIIIVASLLYFLWKLNVRRIKTKHEYEMSKFEAEKLHEVDELKSRFFANISHEFRTPLTLILGPAKDVIESTKETKTKQNVGLIKRNANRLLRLVNQLLDLSKLEAGRMKLETREQNIIPLLKGLVLSFSSLADLKKITLKLNTIEEDIRVYLDRDKIEKIINNLLSNAFKFTPEGGSIEVSVTSYPELVSGSQADIDYFSRNKITKQARLPDGQVRNDKLVEITISDTGKGISKVDIDKIFDRFYQVDGSHTREQEGTGIGLALTKELVELHKGKIKVDSEEGKGTTFIVSIPLGRDHLKSEEIIESVREDEELTQMEKVIFEPETKKEKTDIDVLLETDKPLLLIVEDNSDVRKYIISHLEDNYRIQEAIDGIDGLEQAFNHIPDLIVSDVMMPKMDGFEMCNKLKTDERTSHIPIIMLTAKATSQDKIAGYETGADDYIMKPFDATELKVRVKNLIEIRRKLQEKFKSNDYSVPEELSSIDEQFMKRVLNVLNEHISEEEFSIDELGKEVAMSRQHLYRKIKAISGKSPSVFIRSVKLAKARKLIKERKGTIAEISFSVGFGSPAYFDKCFKEEFGYSPGELTQ